jgi:hypothetical protein
MCGSDLNLDELSISRRVWIFDNEPRNREIVDKIKNKIDQGENVVIWPTHIDEKDINEMVINNLPVNQIIKQNTFSGVKAKLQFSFWKKI